jgi:hypothetical protein
MNWIYPKRQVFVFAFLLSLNGTCAASDVIYKCTAASGAVTFSAKPCVGSEQAKKIEPVAAVVGAEPVLPGNIPGRRGQISPEPPVDTSLHRTPMPQVLESCRKELFDLKRVLDARFVESEKNLKAARAALEQNTTELGASQTSKVGLQWGLILAQQRRDIEQRLKDAETTLALFYPDEKAKFEEIAKRCRKN